MNQGKMAHPPLDTAASNHSNLYSRIKSEVSGRSFLSYDSSNRDNTPSKRHGLTRTLIQSKHLISDRFHNLLRYRYLKLLMLSCVGSLLFVTYQLILIRYYEQSMLQMIIGNNQDHKKASKKRQIVLLAGPHKTGTTSIQSNLYSWTTNAMINETSQTNVLLPSWYWPVPNTVIVMEKNDPNNFDWTAAKGFYALLEAMRNHSMYRVENRLLFQNYTYDQVVDMYRDELRKSWDMGYNILLGTEAMDYCVKDSDGIRLLNEFLKLLPENEYQFTNEEDIAPINNHITAVVTYRSPRVGHLVSIWHQTKKKVENFRDWMITTKNELGSLDSLALTEILLNAGIKVVLIDSSGLAENGYDISAVVACDILGAACTSEKTLIELQTEPMIKNIKAHKNFNLNVERKELDDMDDTMRRYDCKFKHLISHPSLTVLYAHDLYSNFEKCTNTDNMTRTEMKQKLVDVIMATDRDRMNESNKTVL